MGTNMYHRNLMKTGFGLLFVSLLLQTGTEAQEICTAPPPPLRLNENNEVGAVVATIEVVGDVTLAIQNPDVPFDLVGNDLVVTQVLDYESGTTSYTFNIQCTNADDAVKLLNIIIVLGNLNDNSPSFDESAYSITVSELTPINEVVGTFKANDPDMDRLIYSITSVTSDVFKLKSSFIPEIVVAKPLDYDKIKSVQLTLAVQDSDPAIPSHTASTIIHITITDADNRPPWFQPCTEMPVEGGIVCPNMGYRGAVSLGKLETGPLELKPNHIWAIDGDNGINVPIKYSVISGAEDFFEISPETGNITLLKAVDVTKTFQMTVMASQTINSYQFATTSLTINVVTESLHKPQFEKPLYEAVVQGVGMMAVDAADKSKVLKILATDQDYVAAGGINPNIVYTLTGTGSNGFSFIDGYLFTPTVVAAEIYNLEVEAEDRTTFETATTRLSVEVLPEPTTTLATTTIFQSTAEMTTVLTTVPTTVPTSVPTTAPTAVTPDLTTMATPATEGSTGSTGSTATTHTGSVIQPPGSFRSGDMAALGASLGCLLFLCIVVIAFLVVKLRKGDAAWKKINEASVFRSSVGPSGEKEGVQFTNEAFQHDSDDKDNKKGPSGGGLENGTVLSGLGTDKPQARSIPRPPSPIQDEEKEVKPILTKDKLKEDGYKAVWFKEDIDPNAKEEVVIIPERAEDEEDEEEEEGEKKIPKVKFNEGDRDSGLGDKTEDSEEEAVTSSL